MGAPERRSLLVFYRDLINISTRGDDEKHSKAGPHQSDRSSLLHGRLYTIRLRSFTAFRTGLQHDRQGEDATKGKTIKGIVAQTLGNKEGLDAKFAHNGLSLAEINQCINRKQTSSY